MDVTQQWVIGRDSPPSALMTVKGMVETSGSPAAVCFDYFDTIVTRRVEPEYTKEMVSHLLSRLLCKQFSGDQIYEHRRQIEEDLCRLNHEKNGELEFLYVDLCRDLHGRLLTESGDDTAFPDLEKFSQEMLAIELAVEKRVQEVCPEVKHVLEGLHDSGVRLILVSDFYLPETEFLKLLDHHRLTHFFERVYLSAACGMSKGSGRIYPFICEELGIKASNMLMIGDNPHADINMAAQHGVHSLQVVRPSNEPLSGSHQWKEDQKGRGLVSKTCLSKSSCRNSRLQK